MRNFLYPFAAWLAFAAPSVAQEDSAIKCDIQIGNCKALVVGINEYALFNDWPHLTRSVSDAKHAQDTLTHLGFQVTLVTDTRIQRGNPETSKKKSEQVRYPGATDYASIRAEWERLLGSLLPSDEMLVFFFSGHGLELDGQNFLIAADNRYLPHLPNHAKSNALDLQKLLRDLAEKQQQAKNVKGVFIIDACRENPHSIKSGALRDKIQGMPRLDKGLAPIHPPKEVFLMFAAGIGQKSFEPVETSQPNQTSEEPGSVGLSIYARILFTALKNQSGEPLARIAQSIRRKVYITAARSGEFQSPAYYDQFLGDHSVKGPINSDEGPFTHEPNDKNFKDAMAHLIPLVNGTAFQECRSCPEMVVVREAKLGTDSTQQPFAIAKFETTIREWNECVAAMEKTKKGCEGTKLSPTSGQNELFPATNVSWLQAKQYVDWLNSRTSHVNNPVYDLPTHEQWEFAARGNAEHKSDYSFSAPTYEDAKRRLCKFANGADQSTGTLYGSNYLCTDNSGRAPMQVGSFLPNAFGIFDVHGNVWEWVKDCNSGTHKPTPTSGHTSGMACARGGSWRSGAEALKLNSINKFSASHKRNTLGFRVIRKLAQDE